MEDENFMAENTDNLQANIEKQADEETNCDKDDGLLFGDETQHVEMQNLNGQGFSRNWGRRSRSRLEVCCCIWLVSLFIFPISAIITMSLLFLKT